MKVITSEIPKLLVKKGCDASNLYDEEIQEDDLEFSDDEKEKEYKRSKKESKKSKGLEDGEILVSKKRKQKFL